MPNLATYISQVSQIQPALSAGVDELILEDSKCAARSFSNDFDQPGFKTLETYARVAREIQADITLSVNVDILVHERHMGLIYQLLKTMDQLSIQKIRIQDPGLIPLLQEHAPDTVIVLGTETGNANTPSIAAYTNCTYAQHLSNELPASDIQAFQETLSTPFDLQVHGPILIQYSNRRFMTGSQIQSGTTDTPEFDAPTIRKNAQAKEYPGRFFPFLDNPHGHFMFLYFDRCLIKSLPDLVALDLDTWIIDGRGEDEDYAPTAIATYKDAFMTYQEDPENWSAAGFYDRLTSAAKRPLRPGFFKVNRTDYMPRRHAVEPEGYECVGKVLDAVKGHCVTVELLRGIRATDQLLAITPNLKEKELGCEGLRSPDGRALEHAESGELVCLGWVKAMTAKTLLYRKVPG